MRLCTHLVEYKEGDFSKCHHIRLIPYGNFVRSYKNLIRNMVSYKIQSFLIRLKILVK